VQDAGFQFGFDPIKVKFKPTAKDMQTAEESGTDLAQIVRKKIKKEEKQASMQQKQASASPLLEIAESIIGNPNALKHCWKSTKSTLLEIYEIVIENPNALKDSGY
jgi:hypothetical protein